MLAETIMTQFSWKNLGAPSTLWPLSYNT